MRIFFVSQKLQKAQKVIFSTTDLTSSSSFLQDIAQASLASALVSCVGSRIYTDLSSFRWTIIVMIALLEAKVNSLR